MKAMLSRLFRMPEMLVKFLIIFSFLPSHFIQSAMTVGSIGQCIVKAFLPRSNMFPILSVLAVEMSHVFASVWLNKSFNDFPFAELYHEITRIKHGVIMSEDAVNIVNSGIAKVAIFMADNLDHNIATLKYCITLQFRGMGIRVVITNFMEWEL